MAHRLQNIAIFEKCGAKMCNDYTDAGLSYQRICFSQLSENIHQYSSYTCIYMYVRVEIDLCLSIHIQSYGLDVIYIFWYFVINEPISGILNVYIIANGFPRANNTSFVFPKRATVYEVCHIR